MARLLFTSSLRAFPLFSQPYPVSSFSSPLLSLASTSRLVPLSSPRLLSTDQTKPQREPFLASRYLADSVLEAIVEHPSLTSSTDPEEAVLAQKNRILGTEESPNIEALVRWPREQKGSLNHHFTCHAAHKYSRILGCGAEDLSDHVTKVLNQRASGSFSLSISFSSCFFSSLFCCRSHSHVPQNLASPPLTQEKASSLSLFLMIFFVKLSTLLPSLPLRLLFPLFHQMIQ